MNIEILEILRYQESWDIRNIEILGIWDIRILIVISLYYYFLVSFFLILRMMITLYIYSVHERMKEWKNEWKNERMNEKTIIYKFEEMSFYSNSNKWENEIWM